MCSWNKRFPMPTYEIEKLTGTLRNYDSLIEYMTVTIDLREVTTRETGVHPGACHT